MSWISRRIFPDLFGGEKVNDDPIDILGHGVKRCGVEITDPKNLAERGHATPVEACESLVKSCLGGYDLNYIGHQSCVSKTSTGERKDRDRKEFGRLKAGNGSQPCPTD